MDFLYLFKALLRRKWIVIGVTLLAMVAAFLFTMGSEKVYRATAQFSTGFTQRDIQVLTDDKSSLQTIDIRFNNVIENMTSPRVRSLVSYSLMLHDLQSGEPFKRLTEKQQESPNFKAISPETVISILKNKVDSITMLATTDERQRQVSRYIDLYEYDIATLAKNLEVARFQRSDYINVVYSSENPNLSAFVANETGNQYMRLSTKSSGSLIGASVTTLDSILQAKKDTLDKRNQAKTRFMASAQVIDVNSESQSAMSQISSFEGLLIEEKGLRQGYTYQVEQLNGLIREARAKQNGSATTNKNNGEYIRLRNERTDLVNRYKASGSTDKILASQIRDIDQRMAKIPISTSGLQTTETDQTLDDLIQKKIAAEAQVRSSNEKIASYESKIGMLNGGQATMAVKGADITQLNKDIEVAQQEYTEAKNRLDQAKTLGTNAQTGFSQTLVAEPPLRPEPSKRMILMLLAGFSAFFIASAVVIAKALLDKSIRTPSNFHRLTTLPLIGVINNVKFRDVNILEQVSFFDDHDNERGNMFKEFLRKLRFELESSGKRIFLFTSTEPNHGKTSLIQALAYSLSLGKKRVLIIDTNFCNNDLTMAIHASPVLEKFELDGRPFSSAEVSKLVTKTSAPGVNIIGCAGGDYTPSEGLPKNHLLNYLHDLHGDYEYIFLEGAPLNGFTDTKELTAFADGVIAVFSADQVLSEADYESIDFLKDNDKFLGAVLNKVQDDNINQ